MNIRQLARMCLVCCTAMSAAWGQGQYQKLDNGVILQADSVRVRVLVCDSRTLRVTVAGSAGFASRPSLVVTKQWSAVPWKSIEQKGSVIVSAGRAAARIDSRSGAVTFTDGRGNLLVREDPADAHRLEPALVAGEHVYHLTQRFRLSSDEGIYGLGQFEYGIMDYRDHDIVLIQNNRHIVVPLVVSSRKYGIYWDNYSDTRFHDGNDGMVLRSEVGDQIDYYLIAGSSLDDVIAGYREATGRVPMFPRWAFGYWQSRERYENQNQLMSVAREYRQRDIPIDNIVQDWQYWGTLGWNAMAFDSSIYPDPKGMIDSLHRLYNLHLMVSIWPQVDSATAVYKALKATGHLYPTKVWNGGKTYDAYSNEARDIYWKYLNKGLYSLGVDAWWADATEPDSAWCDTPEEEKIGILANGMTALGPSSRYLNTYALMTTTGIYHHQRETNPERRVMMLTRSAFAGQQRNSMAVWSGDISSTWKVFRNQIAGGVNFSMAGIPWWNSDIGGFLPKEYGGEYPLGPRDSSFLELYVRWFQFGAFSPIFRSHGTDFPREVWQFGEKGSWPYDTQVGYINLRYRLLPYIYSVAWKVTNEQYTLMRGLPMDFGHDRRVARLDNEYMFGPAFLVAPVTEELYYPRNRAVIIPASHLRTPDNQPGLAGAYYKGTAFEKLIQTRRDTSLHFVWTETGGPGVGRDSFTVRWKGKVLAGETGTYQFEITSDDGVNVWVNNQQIMDEMYPAGRQMNFGEIDLKANTWYDITVEYQQVDKAAEITLSWRTPSMLAAYHGRHEMQSVTCYLPGPEGWTDFWTGERLAGGRDVKKQVPLNIMPLFVRAGSIVPLGPVIRYSSEKPADPLEIRIYPGADGEFTLYEDEGDGYGYEQGRYAVIPLRWNEKTQTLTVGERRGSFPGMLTSRTLHILLVRPGQGTGIMPSQNPDRAVQYTGKGIVVGMSGKG